MASLNWNLPPVLSTRVGPTDLMKDLIRRASALAFIQVIGMGLSLVLNVAMARWLGAVEFGVYTYVLAWVGVLGVMGVFGLDRMIVRDVSVYHTQAAWGLLRGALGWANGVTVLVSVIIYGCAFLSHTLLVHLFHFRSLPPRIWQVAGVLVPLIALIQVQQSTLRGLGRPVGSQFPRTVLQPTVMLGLAVAILAVSGALTVGRVIYAYTIASGVVLGFSVWLVYRNLPREIRDAPRLFRHRAWMLSASHLFLLTGLDVVNGQIDILALGAFRSPEIVGTYSAALRGASLIPLALSMTVVVMAPTLASLHAAGEQAGLRRLVVRMSQAGLLGGVPVAVGMIVFGRWFLLLFGSEFVHGQMALTILSCGQLVNIATGPVASLLTMTGHERDAVVGLGVGAGANCLLSLSLIPLWGINGAAAAAAVGLVVWNAFLWRYARRRLATSPATP